MFNQTPLEWSTFITCVVTLLGGGIVVQWSTRRQQGREAVSAFVSESKVNAQTINSNSITIAQERKHGKYVAIALVPLSTYCLDKIPAILPGQLLVNINATDGNGKRLHSRANLRKAADFYLSVLRSCISQYNASVRRHELLIGNADNLDALLVGLEESTFAITSALVSIADYLVHKPDGSVIRGWIDPDHKFVDHVTAPGSDESA
jgi:hypothetical protein